MIASLTPGRRRNSIIKMSHRTGIGMLKYMCAQ